MKTFRNILVPTDFSEYSLAVCDYLYPLTRRDEVGVHLLFVVPDPVNEVYYSGFGADPAYVLQDAIERADKELQIFIEHRLRDFQNVRRAVRHGEPSREIVRYAREEKIDLVLMATHGRTGLSHVLMGSVAEKVIRHSPIPVLTVKPENLQTPRLSPEDVEEQLHLPK